MHEEAERRKSEAGDTSSAEETRLQQGGEGGTTRFGMEDGDNPAVPATGGPTSDEEAPERSS